MKNFHSGLMCLFISALLLSACSKDESEPVNQTKPEELINLSLNISLLDFEKKSLTKQELDDFPECAEDTPFYIEIILMHEGAEIVGNVDVPFRIDLARDQMFTQDVPEMQLPPGLYYLNHCAVYTESGNLMCLAPKADSPMAALSDAPMPMSLNLRAGSKPFPDVPVMCYDNRDVNEYGYVFFDIEPISVTNFCFFANYCDDNGRHFPARYSLDISVKGNPIYSEILNNTGENENGENFADPVCVDLPVYDSDEDYIDYTLTLLPWEGVYDIEEELQATGSLSGEDIQEHFDGTNNIEYEHIFFNCDNSERDIALPDFESVVFSNPTNISNPYYGPGEGYIYKYESYEIKEGEISDEPSEEITIERKTETKEILGIQTIIQRDYVSEDGVIREDTNDWLAQDDEGNVWYMGEDSKNYDEEGNYIGNEGSWEAGIDGALPGYWLPANPYVGQRYYQEFYEGEAEDWAEVIAIDETVVLETGTFENVLVTKDINPFEPGVYELKYYAPGTGFIKEEKYEDGELLEVVYLVGIIIID